MTLGGVNRVNFAYDLENCGLQDAADRQWRLAGLVGDPLSDAYYFARMAMRKEDYEAAARAWQRYRLGFLRPGSSAALACHLSAMHREHRCRAHALLKEGEVREALKQVAIAFEAYPGRVDATIALVKHMDKLGYRKEADCLFKQSHDVHAKIVAKYPMAWKHHQAIAEICEGCKRRVEDGKRHATLAREHTPKWYVPAP